MPKEKKGETGMQSRGLPSTLCFGGGHVNREVYTLQFLLEKWNTVHEMPDET